MASNKKVSRVAKLKERRVERFAAEKKEQPKTAAVALAHPASAKDKAVEKLRGGLPASIEERWALIEKGYSDAAQIIFTNGAALLTIQADLPHGDFLAGLEDRGIAKSTAYNMMKVARAFGENIAAFKKILPSKLYTLVEAGMSAEDYDPEKDTLGGTPLDEIDRLPVRKLKTALREHKDKEKKLSKNLEAAETKIGQLEKQLHPVANSTKDTLKVAAEIRVQGLMALAPLGRINLEEVEDAEIIGEFYAAVATNIIEHMEWIRTLEKHRGFVGVNPKGLDTSTAAEWLVERELIPAEEMAVNA
ncbi:MAG: hypothetical protein HZB29_09915 [Nitrospinae bacterium]|nr:hypothetical protein [Nitrospinota bacterium]